MVCYAALDFPVVGFFAGVCGLAEGVGFGAGAGLVVAGAAFAVAPFTMTLLTASKRLVHARVYRACQEAPDISRIVSISVRETAE